MQTSPSAAGQPQPDMPSPQYAAPAPNQPTGSSAKKYALIGSVACVLLAGTAAAGYWAYDTYYALTPEKIVLRAMEANDDIASFASQTDLEFSLEKIEGAPADESLADFEQAMLDQWINQKLTVSLGMEAIRQADNRWHSNLELSATTDIGVFEASAIALPPTLYVRLERLPLMIAAFLPPGAMDAWVSFDETDLEETIGEDLDNEENKELQQRLETIVEAEAPEAFVARETMPLETVAGRQAYRLTFDIDQAELIDLLQKLNQAVDDEDRVPAEDIESFRQELAKQELPVIEAWVDTETFYILRFATTVTARFEEQGLRGIMAVDSTMSRHNEPLTVTAPETARPFEEIMEEAMSTMMEDAGAGMESGSLESFDEADLETDADGDGLSDWEEENLWETDPNNADSDGDGHGDGTEIENGYNPNGEGTLF